jgi:hypothetical protein
MLKLQAVAFAALFAVACGGSPPPAATSTPTTASSQQGGPGATGNPDSPAKDGSAQPWADQQREPFMQGCMSRAKAPDYCSCGFDLFREIFKDGPAKDADSDPRVADLQKRMIGTCGSKLPEDLVKTTFLSSCIQDDKRKAAYCECAWPALRKKLAVADFVTDFTGPRFDDAKKAMVAVCKGKFPTDIAKAEFMKGCTKEDAARNPKCECAWKKLRGKFSTEEIVAGTFKPDDVPGLTECK